MLITQAIHTLDLALSLTGPVAEVAAICGTTGLHRMETEDFAGAGPALRQWRARRAVRHHGRVSGLSRADRADRHRATAVLAAGVVTLHHHDGRRETIGAEQSTGGGADPMAFPHDAHRALLTDFLDALDQGRDPQASGREALKVHRFIDAVLRASAEGRSGGGGDRLEARSIGPRDNVVYRDAEGAWERQSMNFGHILHAAIGLLVVEGRLSYRRLQAEFDLDDSQLEALRFELTEVKRLAVDQCGEILAWAGDGDGARGPGTAPGVRRRSRRSGWPGRRRRSAQPRCPHDPCSKPRLRSSRSSATPSGGR